MPEIRTTALPVYVEQLGEHVAVTALPIYVEVASIGSCLVTAVMAYAEVGEPDAPPGGGVAGSGIPEMIGPYRIVRPRSR